MSADPVPARPRPTQGHRRRPLHVLLGAAGGDVGVIVTVEVDPAAPMTNWSAAAEPLNRHTISDTEPECGVDLDLGGARALGGGAWPERTVGEIDHRGLVAGAPVDRDGVGVGAVAPPAHGTLLSVSAVPLGGHGRRLVRVQATVMVPAPGTGCRLRGLWKREACAEQQPEGHKAPKEASAGASARGRGCASGMVTLTSGCLFCRGSSQRTPS